MTYQIYVGINPHPNTFDSHVDALKRATELAEKLRFDIVVNRGLPSSRIRIRRTSRSAIQIQVLASNQAWLRHATISIKLI